MLFFKKGRRLKREGFAMLSVFQTRIGHCAPLGSQLLFGSESCLDLSCFSLSWLGLSCFGLSCLGLSCLGLRAVWVRELFGSVYWSVVFDGLNCLGLRYLGLSCLALTFTKRSFDNLLLFTCGAM